MPEGPASPSGETRAHIGPYEILKVLSRAGREMTCLGIEPRTEREVAIRVVPDSRARAADMDMTQELSLPASLVHRNILRVLDAGHDSGLSYVVEEVRRGRVLSDILRDQPPTLDLSARLDLVAQLCIGLHYAHAHGVVHGDVRPANVFVTDEGVVKLLNVGTSSADDLTVVSDNAAAGSFEYMAPEQLVEPVKADGRTDVFAAAAILYELLSGRRPFQRPSPAATLAAIARDEPPPLEGMPALDALVRRGLAKDPAKRFSSAQEFAYALWTAQFGPSETEREEEAPQETLYVQRELPTPSPTSAFERALARLPISRELLVYVGVGAAVMIVSATIFLSC